MAVTADQLIVLKDPANAKIATFPIKASTQIYKGALAIVGQDGYLVNATAANIGQAQMVVIPFEVPGTLSASNGSIDASGNATFCAKCYISGTFKAAMTSITQAMVGQTIFASDNFTFDDESVSAIPVGTLTEYLSATSGYIELNSFRVGNQVRVKVPLVAAADNTAGGILTWQNPTKKAIILDQFYADVTTGPTDTAFGIDIGVAATVASSDTIIDGAVLAAARVIDFIKDAGTNGSAIQKIASDYYITGTSSVSSHYDAAALVGTATIVYHIA